MPLTIPFIGAPGLRTEALQPAALFSSVAFLHSVWKHCTPLTAKHLRTELSEYAKKAVPTTKRTRLPGLCALRTHPPGYCDVFKLTD